MSPRYSNTIRIEDHGWRGKQDMEKRHVSHILDELVEIIHGKWFPPLPFLDRTCLHSTRTITKRECLRGGKNHCYLDRREQQNWKLDGFRLKAKLRSNLISGYFSKYFFRHRSELLVLRNKWTISIASGVRTVFSWIARYFTKNPETEEVCVAKGAVINIVVMAFWGTSQEYLWQSLA